MDVMKTATSIGIGALTVMAVLYGGSVLSDALNNSNVATVWNNVVLFFSNFTSQLANAGTVLGAGLILAIIAVALLYFNVRS